jgi:hypothetical protein
VEHSEQLTPVQPGLKVGATFDEANLEKGTATRSWYRVPPWLAGKWQSDEQTQMSNYDYTTGVTTSQKAPAAGHSSVTYGSQRDRAGGIWDFIDMPRLAEVTSDRAIYKDLHTNDSVVFDADARVVMSFVCTRTSVDKATNTIVSVYQYEQFNAYTPNAQDTIRVDASKKSFDQGGKATNLSKAWMLSRKVAPFSLNNRQDVRPSFREFLKSQGLDNLVPQDQ